MTDSIPFALKQILSGNDLTVDAAHAAVSQIMDGEAEPTLIAALLTALRMKGEAVSEIVGAARAMRERVVAIPTTQTELLDTCGTGGDELQTFNISTATALVAAAAGVKVAKHGNRSVSSSSGSAEVLEALGVNISLSPEQVSQTIDQVGIGFCYAPLLHQAMKHAAPVRKQLVFRTIFNLLGPLTNPAGAEYQLLGANRNSTAEMLAHALADLGCKQALVVCGGDELDEVCLWAETVVYRVAGGDVREERWDPELLGLPTCRVEELQVTSPEQSAAVIRGVLDGKPGAARNIVLANTAAALVAAGRTDNPQTAVSTAVTAIDSNQAAQVCRQLVEVTNSF